MRNSSFSRKDWRRLEQVAAFKSYSLKDQLLSLFMDAFKRPADEQSGSREAGVNWVPVIVRVER